MIKKYIDIYYYNIIHLQTHHVCLWIFASFQRKRDHAENPRRRVPPLRTSTSERRERRTEAAACSSWRCCCRTPPLLQTSLPRSSARLDREADEVNSTCSECARGTNLTAWRAPSRVQVPTRVKVAAADCVRIAARHRQRVFHARTRIQTSCVLPRNSSIALTRLTTYEIIKLL